MQICSPISFDKMHIYKYVVLKGRIRLMKEMFAQNATWLGRNTILQRIVAISFRSFSEMKYQSRCG